MLSPLSPLLAQRGMEEVLTVLAFFGPFWLTIISLVSLGMILHYRRKARERELGAEMIRDMLARKMSVEEVERVLVAWAGRRSHLKKLVQAQMREPAAWGKPARAI